MIRYFSVENYKSIKNENTLDFDSHLPKEYGFVANPVVGFAGANASGKTSILQALTFVLWFMGDSFLQLEEGSEIPVEPFWTVKETSTTFNIIFAQNSLVDGEYKRIDYEYQLSLTKKQVLSEALYYYPYGRKRVAYLRDGNRVRFGATIRHIDTTDLRHNSSIISFAALFSSQRVAAACKSYLFQSNLHHNGAKENEFRAESLETLLKDEEMRQRVQFLLNLADVGIEEVYLRELDIPAAMISSHNKRIKRPFFKHRIDNQLVDFSLDLESAGTIQFLATLPQVINGLKDGAVLILDEVELKLHQDLVSKLVELFEDPAENPKGAQLIFSFHNTFLMETLKPAQLWFTEKNDEGHTEIFSAVDFKDIKRLHHKDLEMLYRAGRFGAKPRGI